VLGMVIVITGPGR